LQENPKESPKSMKPRICSCFGGCLKHGINTEPKELAPDVICQMELDRNFKRALEENRRTDSTATVEIPEGNVECISKPVESTDDSQSGPNPSPDTTGQQPKSRKRKK